MGAIRRRFRVRVCAVTVAYSFPCGAGCHSWYLPAIVSFFDRVGSFGLWIESPPPQISKLMLRSSSSS